MRSTGVRFFQLLTILVLAVLAASIAKAGDDARLPKGVKAVWDLRKAWRESTETRERVCINGLWRWQPAGAAGEAGEAVPANGWGYFKVPGCWPGITNYMQKDCQSVYTHPGWSGVKLRGLTAAWHQREITVPRGWKGRRIFVRAEYLNSFATVFVDGEKAGEMRFPGGEVEITKACRPGRKHLLSILVMAMPLKGVMLSYNDTASARAVKGTVARRGLVGDVWLVSTPPEARIADVKVDTSVRRFAITFDAALDGLKSNARYALTARISDDRGDVAEFTSKAFRARDLKDGRFAFTKKWKPDRLWDTHTPENLYDLHLSLRKSGGDVLDAAHPVNFGFREFRIEGRDFLLNGSRIFLSSVALDNAQVSAALATKEAARESFLRLRNFGINFVYTHNYGCQPGSHLSFAEILDAADEVGMLVAFSQPHFGHYDWKEPEADRTNGYARHAEFYVRVAQNHPSVVAYAMSHNATGYSEDMNPDLMDGVSDPRNPWAQKNVVLARRAEAIVKNLDPGRIVYHHSSGNLGSMHTSNFYANFVPVQEMSDWFGFWAANGQKPVFLCEYAVPFSWDWTMYRGWFRGKRTFGSAKVPWEFCLAEWNSQFLGDRAFKLSEREKRNLRWEAGQYRAGRLWHRWDYPTMVGSSDLTERDEIFAEYLTENWRAFRTHGLSAFGPWNHGPCWRLRDGVDKSRRDCDVDWEKLQRPGLSPDYVEGRYERHDLAFEEDDWVPTLAGEALLRNNRPLLAFVAGKPGAATSKDHNFLPGEAIRKQLVIVNNSRVTVTCECEWSLALPEPQAGAGKAVIQTGGQERLPLDFDVPAETRPGRYELSATVRFDNAETQTDSFVIHVLPPSSPPQTDMKIALFDPEGETGKLLKEMGVRVRRVRANAGLGGYDALIVGRSALTVDGPGPDLSRVRDGLKVLVFEQTSEVLSKRLGFRVTEYGLRRVFQRIPDHPLLLGLAPEHLCDWRGAATLLPPRLTYERRPGYGPTVKWCGLPVTRPWRCGNRGNVASVLIEKPARGDFLPILDGGFSLQYSPLLEYREGGGMVLFCQMDVTGRTEDDPAAKRLAGNLLTYLASWEAQPRRRAVYVGESSGRDHLRKAGFEPREYTSGGKLGPEDVLVAGPGSGERLARSRGAVSGWLKRGGLVLAVGLSEEEARAGLSCNVTTSREEHIGAFFDPPAADSLLAGVGPADVHNRDPRPLDLVTGGAVIVGDGVLAVTSDCRIVFCQMAPWHFDYEQAGHVKRTFRRTSFLLSRLLGNLGCGGSTPLLSRFAEPADKGEAKERRWLDGLYLDEPAEWDDPYRFFRW